MGKALIITEKPSVAMEFAKALGVREKADGCLENEDYVITWCVGHLVGLVYPEEYDEKYKKWKLEDLPFLPSTYKYDVIPSVKQQYKIVNKMLHRKDIDKVYWAGDAGKEGQTIEENIRNFGGVREGMEELRVWIDSQTEEEILRGIREAKPMSDYENLGKSGIMRTIEDYAMGINFSRAMSVKYGNMLNRVAGTKNYTAIAVGRVMTCVLGMVVTREREIRNFKETPFYRVIGNFTDEGIEAEWKAVENSKYFDSPLLYKENGFREEKDAKSLIENCQGKEAVVKALEKTISKKKAPLLFNLAELQAECAKRFKISPDETLQVAQDLYEKKLTTYPRTDARVLSTAVAKEIHKNVNGLKNYEPISPFAGAIIQNKAHTFISKTIYVDDSKITDHYAIIPTGQLTELSTLTEIQGKVFELICRRFLSIFYPAAEYQNVKMTIGVGQEAFFASAKVLTKPGYLEVSKEHKSEEDDSNNENQPQLFKATENLNKGDIVSVEGYKVKQGQTSPPKRYTSGSMILAMENAGQLIEDEELRAQIKGSGIGTSATRAEIIKKLVRIGYLALNKKTQVLTPENFGEMIYEVVALTVPELLNPKMTANWEKGLDGITKGEVDFNVYKTTLEDFIYKETNKMIDNDLSKELADKISPFSKKGTISTMNTTTGIKCPACGGDIVKTPFGYGCSNYKSDKSGCNFVIGQIAGISLNESQVRVLIEKGQTPIIKGFKSKSGKKFDASLKMEKTEEKNFNISFEFPSNEPQDTSYACPKCGTTIVNLPKLVKCKNECGFILWKTVCNKDLSDENIKALLKKGRTSKIFGFKSKAGKKFDASLVMKDDFSGVDFDFS